MLSLAFSQHLMILQNAVMLIHEMQQIKPPSRVCSAELRAVGEVSAQAVRARLIQEGFLAVDSAAFSPMLQFVIEQVAGGDHAFVEPLVQFHELIVNPRARRLRVALYVESSRRLFICYC